MDVLFCDLCNESVPQTDLDEGRAFVRRGRVICARCERAMTHADAPGVRGPEPQAFQALDPELTADPATASEAASATVPAAVVAESTIVSERIVSSTAPAALIPSPTVPPPERRSSSGLVLAMVALIFAAGAVAVLNEQIRELGEREAAVETQLRTQNLALQDAERTNDAVRGDLGALEGDIAMRIASEREGREAALASLRTQAERAETEQRELLARIAEIQQGAAARTEDADRRSDELSHRLAKSEDENRALLERIAKLEEQIEQSRLSVVPASGPPSGGPGAGGPAGPGTLSWTALVPDLSSPKAATRWEAVDQIGQSRDPESVPFLVPMLKDTDVFVRMATARVLGDVQEATAVRSLIDALEDGEAAVREAALGALRVITGKDLRFDPLASEGERAKKVKAWRDWWKKVEEEGGLPPKGQG